ncbi:MAG: single-stranded DNA-binding protein [Actinomycetota bacterium]|nr:single-stranded DNA-binding protein [Actinomycetota bacterium]
MPLAQQAEAATEFLAGLVGAIAGVGRVEVHEIDEHTVEVAVVGDGLGLLIGPSGATLAAVQDLTRTAVQRRTGGRNGRIMVDVGGYREKRRSALERFTREIASQVLETGQRKVLEPMQAADRKVVHDTVNSIDGVATASEGEEPRRRVVIQPV